MNALASGFIPSWALCCTSYPRRAKAKKAKSFPAREEPAGVQALRKHCGPFCQSGKCEELSVQSSVVRSL